jgi:hypothetical protein
MHPKACGAWTVEQEPPPLSREIATSRLDSIPGTLVAPTLDNKDSAERNQPPSSFRLGAFTHGIDSDSRWH